jgi:hypothetical protein
METYFFKIIISGTFLIFFLRGCRGFHSVVWVSREYQKFGNFVRFQSISWKMYPYRTKNSRSGGGEGEGRRGGRKKGM